MGRDRYGDIPLNNIILKKPFSVPAVGIKELQNL